VTYAEKHTSIPEVSGDIGEYMTLANTRLVIYVVNNFTVKIALKNICL
jgi:hypothetical protein